MIHLIKGNVFQILIEPVLRNFCDFFIFDKTFCKQLDGVAIGSPLGPTLANSFLCYHEKRWWDKCPEEFKPVFYRRYMDDIFILFRKEEHLKLFLNYFNSCHKNVKFTSEKETNNKLSFLDIEISRDKNQFITSVYRKPTFSGVFSHLIVSFLGVINST